MTAFARTLQDTAARIVGRTAECTEVERLSPALRRIRLVGPTLQDLELPAAGKFKVRVAEGVFRSYTPAWRDPAAGALDLVAVVHGGGPGSAWAEGIRPGDTTTLLGPKQSFALVPDATQAFVLGDTTTLGLWQAIAQVTGRPVRGAVELPPEDAPAVAALGLDLDVVPQGADRGDALRAWLSAQPLPPEHTAVYLSGHHRTRCALQAHLLERGLDPAWLRQKSYWGEGRKARR
jgi:NADPH-dependent ferric siderophore reductase